MLLRNGARPIYYYASTTILNDLMFISTCLCRFMVALSQINPPPYSIVAEQCIAAGDSFFSDDNCLKYYRNLGLRSSPTAINDAATAICASQACKNRMDSFINYLLTCRVGSVDDDDDDDDVCCIHNLLNYLAMPRVIV